MITLPYRWWLVGVGLVVLLSMVPTLLLNSYLASIAKAEAEVVRYGRTGDPSSLLVELNDGMVVDIVPPGGHRVPAPFTMQVSERAVWCLPVPVGKSSGIAVVDGATHTSWEVPPRVFVACVGGRYHFDDRLNQHFRAHRMMAALPISEGVYWWLPLPQPLDVP